MFGKIRNALLISDFSCSQLKAIRPQIMDENRKFLIVWSIVHELFWAYCLIMSLSNPYYRECRTIYAVAFVLCAVTLGLALFAAPKHPRVIRSAAVILDEVLLVTGILIARHLAPRTIVVFAAVLIIPVSFITDSLSNLLMLAINIIVFALVGRNGMDPDSYGWVLSNLCIFSVIGIMLGHFVNRARFERFIFAESNAELARTQARYARHDQLTDLQNRRAFAEKLEEISKEWPVGCHVVIADINGLKEMNDTAGHNAGDELVIGAAQCLRKCFPGTDAIYRLGGDEFCVIIFDKDYDTEGALNRLQELSANWRGEYIQSVSISAGAVSSEEFDDIESVVKAADRRMYEFKRNYYETSGRDRRRR